MTGRICGTGFCVPEHVMDNEELSRMVETSDEWIRERTGIEKRHIITDETTVSMAAKAAEQALEDAGVPMAAAEVTMIPQTYVALTDPKDIAAIQKTLDLLDDDDDVQDVYHNWEE